MNAEFTAKLIAQNVDLEALVQIQADRIAGLEKLLEHSIGSDCREMRYIQEIENKDTRIAELEKEKDRLEKLVHQRFDDGKRLGILDTELKYKFAPQTKPLSGVEIIGMSGQFDFNYDVGIIDFARAIEAKVRGQS